ncbi:MAG TPA: hypothetical protein VFX33_04860 [Actinomycetales bacterium]|nr:hypothetical protein [Actinomycetales bacterium]
MSLPTDFHDDIASRVEQPGYSEVLARAARLRRRRRRTRIAAGLAAACVVGGLAAWGSDWRIQAIPDPASTPNQTRSPLSGEVDGRLPPEVRDLLGGERVDPWSVAGSGAGAAVLWGACPSDEGCRFALVTRLGDRLEGTMLTSDRATLSAIPGGWLLEDGSSTFRVRADGEREPLVDVGGKASWPRAGDTAVETSRGWRLLRGNDLLPLPTPPDTAVTDATVTGAFVTPRGDLLVATSEPAGGVHLAQTEGSGRWRADLLPGATDRTASAVLAGNGDQVAVAVLGDAPDGSIPILGVWISHDAGASWTSGRGIGLGTTNPPADMSSLAVSDEGSAYPATGSHGLIRVGAGRGAVAAPKTLPARSVFGVSSGICFVSETGPVDGLRCSADHGKTWSTSSLPGFR